MSNPTLKELALSLQHSLEHVATMGLHQHVLLELLKGEVQTEEQHALVFSLDCCQAEEFDWRVKAEEQVEKLLTKLEPSTPEDQAPE